MSKVIKFSNRSTDAGEPDEPNLRQLGLEQSQGRYQPESSRNWTFWKVVKVVVMVVRMPVFLVLYFLRAPVMMVCSMFYLPLFLLALFAWYALPEKPQMWGGFGVISLLSFVLMYVYDLVLSWLSPHELIRTL